MTIRVIQWATGSIGRVCLRHVIDREDLTLAGLFAYSKDKVGRDAGDIVRRSPTGVLATDDRDAILALDADVVLHTPLNGQTVGEHDDDLVALLEAGLDVITTTAYTWPHGYGAERLGRLQEACQRGNSTLLGTGINPGTLAERLAMTTTSICTHVDHLFVREVYDCSPVASPGFVFDLAGFGQSPEQFEDARQGREPFFEALFGELIGYVAHGMGITFDQVEADHEVALADEDLDLPAGVVPAGTVSNIRWRWHGHHRGSRLFTVQMDWVLDRSKPGWEAEDGWRIAIEGSPRLTLDMRVEDPVGRPERSKAIQYATAGPAVNAIHDVVAAPAGILVPPTFAPFRPEGATR